MSTNKKLSMKLFSFNTQISLNNNVAAKNIDNNSNTNVTQKGSGSHSAQIVLRGNKPTTLNLTQNSSINKSYSVTQNCVTNGGCNISVTQQ